MAKNQSNRETAYTRPTPAEELDYALERAVDQATILHPQTQKLRAQIQKQMRQVAKNPTVKKTASKRRAK